MSPSCSSERCSRARFRWRWAPCSAGTLGEGGPLAPERFGGIVETERPRALLHVDREMMRELGYPESPLWQLAGEGPLSAPREVHVVLSRRCAAGCRGCYVDATPSGAALPLEEACRILDELAEMRVFHVALGGGEALELDYLFA